MKFTNILFPIFAIIILYFGITTIQTDVNPTVSLEVHNFTTNNTPITLTNTPVNDFGCVMYHYENLTFPLPTDNYDCSNNNVTIYTNGTNVCYPNVTANCNYYTSYSYQKSATIWGMSFSFIIIIVIIAFGLGFVVKNLLKNFE